MSPVTMALRPGTRRKPPVKINKSPKAPTAGSAAPVADDGVRQSSSYLRDEAPRRPSRTHLEQIDHILRDEVLGSSLPLRRAFVVGTEAHPPPLSWLLPRAGLDAVQLKTYLLVLCMAAWRPSKNWTYEVPYDADVYAKAFDLPGVKPVSPKGARRVGDAVRQLERRSLLMARWQGRERVGLKPLREDGSGKAYLNPAGHEFPKPVRSEGHFIQVPHALFRNGWLSVLTGAALTSWLILRASASFDDPCGWVFVSPSQRTSRYHVSQDTYLKGLRELDAHGLISRRDRKTHVGPGPFDFSRQENVQLLLDNFDKRPERPAPHLTATPV
jgi:hypothetical protein